MSEGWNEAEAFGELRSLLGHRPSAELFESCGFGSRQVARFAASPLVGRLEELGLRYGSLSHAGVEHLTDAASRFVSLRVLRLESLDLAAKSAVALAQAPWPPTLERMSFAGGALKSKGLAGFVYAGTLRWLTSDESGHTTLELFDQEVRDPGVKALAACEALGEVDEVVLFSNPITSIGPLVASPFVEGIRRWDLGWTSLEEGCAEDLLELVRRTRPRTLRLRELPLDDAFLTALCTMEESAELEELDLSSSRPRYGLAGLEALLDWPRFAELDAFGGAFRVPRGEPAVARALATGMFDAEDESFGMGWVTLVRRFRKETWTEPGLKMQRSVSFAR